MIRTAMSGFAAALLAVNAGGIGLFAQGVPNFSGKWTAVPGASQPAELPGQAFTVA